MEFAKQVATERSNPPARKMSNYGKSGERLCCSSTLYNAKASAPIGESCWPTMSWKRCTGKPAGRRRLHGGEMLADGSANPTPASRLMPSRLLFVQQPCSEYSLDSLPRLLASVCTWSTVRFDRSIHHVRLRGPSCSPMCADEESSWSIVDTDGHTQYDPEPLHGYWPTEGFAKPPLLVRLCGCWTVGCGSTDTRMVSFRCGIRSE